MKHTLTDRLDVFRFHDANLTLVAWDGDCLTLCAEHLILGKEANPDHPDTDMELSATRLTLSGIRVAEYELGRAWVTDENGGKRYISPIVLYSGIAARDRFREELCRTVRVVDLCEEDGLYELSACGTEPYFTVRFRISGVRAEFDAFDRGRGRPDSAAYSEPRAGPHGGGTLRRDGQYRILGEDAVRKRRGGCLRGSARVACAGTAGRDVGQMLLHLPVRKSVRRERRARKRGVYLRFPRRRKRYRRFRRRGRESAGFPGPGEYRCLRLLLQKDF